MKALMGHHHHHHHHQQQEVVAAVGVGEDDAAEAETEYYYCDREEAENAIATRSSRGLSREANQNHNQNHNHNPNPNPNLNQHNLNPNHKQKHRNQDYQHHNPPRNIHDCEDLAMMEQAQISVLALLLAAVRRSAISCHSLPSDEIKMDIGWPTDVQHVAHVTFDRFNGFLGLPLEFEVGRVPSASASVFGVSPESMQCSYDRHGHSVPTILLLLQERLYSQGGLKAEGIFRINAENSQEKHVRDQLNKGIVPENIDVHCLAGLIKAWLRELPEGVLDSIPPELFLQCNTEEQCLALVEMLPPSESALLNWVVSLMADVVEEEEINKMNAHNIAMVFAPNMTQMSDPLTALMHAVQVMNFLKTLILKALRDWKNVEHDEAEGACTTTVMTTYGLTHEGNNNTRQCSVTTTTSSSEANVKPKQCDGIEDDERKGDSEQDRYSLDVEERFFRGFSGRGANGDIVVNERLVHGNMQSCL